VAARSKAWVCGRLLAGIAGSNPVVAWMSVVIVVYCEVEVSASTDQSSRGVLPNVVRRCV